MSPKLTLQIPTTTAKLTITLMLTMNRKLLEFFVCIPKLEVDGLNWVIFKDHLAFAAAAAGLEKHIDSTGTSPNPLAFTLGGPFPLTAEQVAKLEH